MFRRFLGIACSCGHSECDATHGLSAGAVKKTISGHLGGETTARAWLA